MLISSLLERIFEKLMKFSIFLLCSLLEIVLHVNHLSANLYVHVCELLVEREKLLFFWLLCIQTVRNKCLSNLFARKLKNRKCV